MKSSFILSRKILVAVATLVASNALQADDSFKTAMVHDTSSARQSAADAGLGNRKAPIQRGIEEIVEKGCGPMGTLESFQQAQYERGERKYPPIRLHVLAIAKKLESADDNTFNRLGSEVLRHRDDFRSGRILISDLGAALQTILEQL